MPRTCSPLSLSEVCKAPPAPHRATDAVDGCPRSRQILYEEQLGKGAFGVVNYVWNVTTREEYVVKFAAAEAHQERPSEQGELEERGRNSGKHFSREYWHSGVLMACLHTH